jgi:predicted esterase
MRLSRLLLIILLASAAWAQEVAKQIENRNNAYSDEIEKYFRAFLVDEYPARAARAWNRSYASIAAFEKSVAPNRARYRRMLAPPDLKPTGPLERRAHPLVADVRAEWLSLPLGALKAEGVLALPEDAKGPVPLVIAQHGIGSNPERVFGVGDGENLYHDYGHALVRAGFAVLAPFNLATIEKRNRIERLARLADTTLPGIELVRMQALLTEVLKDKRIDSKRVGMWGISLGGMATMFWMPLEPRIHCGIVCAWFNHRRNKMVIPDARYSCFLETREEHAFFRGWLTEFTDSDVASLICPRPLLVQAGKADRIAHWPQILEELEASRQHYAKLGLAERIDIDLHDGGHEIRLESGLAFLKKWLGAPAR